MWCNAQIWWPKAFVQCGRALGFDNFNQTIDDAPIIFALARIVQRLIVQTRYDHIGRCNCDGHCSASNCWTHKRIQCCIGKVEIISSHILFERLECGQLSTAAQRRPWDIAWNCTNDPNKSTIECDGHQIKRTYFTRSPITPLYKPRMPRIA